MHLIAALPSFLTFSNLLAFAGAIAGLGVVIFVHELGHFLVAKACGVKCEKFYVGFDVPITIGPFKLPAALWKTQWGETEYGIGIVPLGGYVKMLGQHENPQLAAAEAEKARQLSDNPDSDGDQLDPRSFPAKTVLQRMAIISAGVIFNVIFGIVFAAIAYSFGVKYLSTEIGGTIPGESAWMAGVSPSDKIIQFHRDGKRDEQLSFNDLRFNVMWMGDKKPLEVLVKDTAGEERWVTFQAKTREGYNRGVPTIGVTGAQSLEIRKVKYDDFTSCGKSDIKMNDDVLAIIVDGKRQEIASGYALEEFLFANRTTPIDLVVKRLPEGVDKMDVAAITQGEELTIPLPPQPLLDLGMAMKMGPIVGVQTGSPAVDAGFQEGDLLLKIAGDPIADPMFVDDVLMTSIGTPTAVTVLRDEKEIELTVTPRPMRMLGNQTHITRRPDSPISAETLGVAYSVIDEIAVVADDGPAAKAGLQPGDKILNVGFVRAKDGPVDKQLYKRLGLDQEIKFSRDTNEWTFVDKILTTQIPPGIDLKITYDRAGKSDSLDLTPVISSEHFSKTRGLQLWAPIEKHTTTSVAEAFRMGLKEMKHGVLQVFTILSSIGTVAENLGGPIAMAAFATTAASDGLPTLLMFLTMLSANLAVLNFLPIPVLDGGHMMFLLYEGVFGKPMNERVSFFATMVGLSMILCLMLFALGMDISRLPEYFAD